MINKVSDLVKRAIQLADLEGSDFISWNENINLINEAYIELYQKMIDAGEKSFLKSFHMSSGAVKLPFDFWQLKGVYVYNGGHLAVINRRAGNQDLNSVSYELKNNQLIIYGYASDVLVEYFPKPKFLTYKPQLKKVELPELEDDEFWVECNKHRLLKYDESTITLVDLDKESDFYLTFAKRNTLHQAVLRDNLLVIAECFSEDEYHFSIESKIIRLEPSTLTDLVDENGNRYVPVFTENGDVFIGRGNKVFIPQFNDEYNMSELVTMMLDEVAEVSVNLDDGDFWYCDDSFSDLFGVKYEFVMDGETPQYYNEKIIHNGEVVDYKMPFIPLIRYTPKFAFKNGELYFLSKNAYGKITSDNTVELINNFPEKYIGFVGLNEENGYGYIAEKSKDYCVIPWVQDTILNFPNSFFYKYISFALAIAYKIKQGADASGLQYQLNQAEQTFLDSLGEDANQFPRIGNVY